MVQVPQWKTLDFTFGIFIATWVDLTVYYILPPQKRTAGLFMYINKCQFLQKMKGLLHSYHHQNNQ